MFFEDEPMPSQSSGMRKRCYLRIRPVDYRSKLWQSLKACRWSYSKGQYFIGGGVDKYEVTKGNWLGGISLGEEISNGFKEWRNILDCLGIGEGILGALTGTIVVSVQVCKCDTKFWIQIIQSPVIYKEWIVQVPFILMVEVLLCREWNSDDQP